MLGFVVVVGFLIAAPVGTPQTNAEEPFVEVIPDEFLGAPTETPILIICHLGELVEVRPQQDGAGTTEAENICSAMRSNGNPTADEGCPDPAFYKKATQAEGCLKQFSSYKKLKRIIMYFGGPTHPNDYKTTGTYNNYVGHDTDSPSTSGTAITWYKTRSGGVEVGLSDEACHTYEHWKTDHSDYASTKSHWHGTQMEASIRSSSFSACNTDNVAKGYWGGAVDFK